MQARNNVHRAALLLGAAVVGKVGRLGNKLKEHHAKMREEGTALLLSSPIAFCSFRKAISPVIWRAGVI